MYTVYFDLTAISSGESREKRAVPLVSTPHNSSTTAGTSWAEPQPSPRTQHDSPADRFEAQRPPNREVQQVEAQRMPRAEGMAWGEVGEMDGIQRQASIVGPVCGQCELNGAQLVGCCLQCFVLLYAQISGI